jgi:hypothetical protein
MKKFLIFVVFLTSVLWFSCSSNNGTDSDSDLSGYDSDFVDDTENTVTDNEMNDEKEIGNDEEEEEDNEMNDTSEEFDDDPECEKEGETRDVACGLNGRGLKRETCTDGIWVSMECVDPDICIDGDTREDTCGVMGTRTDECVEGQWKTGECVDEYENPDGEIPSASKGKYIYFSAKKIDDKYNSDLYMIDLTGDEPEVVQLTDTSVIDEVSPAIPADSSFMVYSDGYYDDPGFSVLRWVKLDSDGRPVEETDKRILGWEKESCLGGISDHYFGKGNPSVSLDGTEIVFVNTYKADEDLDECPVLAYQPARVSIDEDGNIGDYEAMPWYGGDTPNRMKYVPFSPVYVHDTKWIALSIFGMDEPPLGSELMMCKENCNSWADWDMLTYHETWSSGNVAQRSLAAAMNEDTIMFFRRFPGVEFSTGIYTAGQLKTAGYHPVYGDYGVLETDENFVSGFGGTYFAASYKGLAFSPDGKLVAAAITIAENEINDEYRSELVILDRETGKIYEKFTFEDALRNVDGLIWR